MTYEEGGQRTIKYYFRELSVPFGFRGRRAGAPSVGGLGVRVSAFRVEKNFAGCRMRALALVVMEPSSDEDEDALCVVIDAAPPAKRPKPSAFACAQCEKTYTQTSTGVESAVLTARRTHSTKKSTPRRRRRLRATNAARRSRGRMASTAHFDKALRDTAVVCVRRMRQDVQEWSTTAH